jgi:hypothetical protein
MPAGAPPHGGPGGGAHLHNFPHGSDDDVVMLAEMRQARAGARPDGVARRRLLPLRAAAELHPLLLCVRQRPRPQREKLWRRAREWPTAAADLRRRLLLELHGASAPLSPFLLPARNNGGHVGPAPRRRSARLRRTLDMAFGRATATTQFPIQCAAVGEKTVKVNSRSLWRPVQVAGADSLSEGVASAPRRHAGGQLGPSILRSHRCHLAATGSLLPLFTVEWPVAVGG